MKVRSGFVSNSSSSSFVLVTSVENHERVLSELTEYEQAVAEAMAVRREHTLFGKKVVVVEEYSGGEWWTVGELDLGEKWTAWEKENPDARCMAWEEYTSKMDKSPKDEVFSITVYDS